MVSYFNLFGYVNNNPELKALVERRLRIPEHGQQGLGEVRAWASAGQSQRPA